MKLVEFQMKLPGFSIIAAHCNKVIGTKENNTLRLPWDRIPEDMKYFRETTQGATLIVGRKTFETLPPLAGRAIIVVSRSNANLNTPTFPRFTTALLYAETLGRPIFVIGGGQIYEEAIKNPYCEKIYLTEIPSHTKITGTPIAWFPEIPKNYKLYSMEAVGEIIKNIYVNTYNPRSEETTYLESLARIIASGNQKIDRTQVGTISSFGEVLRFNFNKISDEFYTFPLLTTKRMFWKGVVEELLFFLRGDTNNQKLVEKGVHIWDGNTTREFLDKRGMQNFEEGSLGKAYGFQWRFWGAPYLGKNATTDDYSKEKHYDQIQEVIKQLRETPESRRIVLSAWNVSDLSEMCLPPCHTMYVFNVQEQDGKKQLFCHLTQRSGDMFLGIPFNIASASLLTFILAKVSGLEPGGLMMSIVDAHVYTNHIEQCAQQMDRIPYEFPQLQITKTLNSIEDIEQLTIKDFDLQNYTSHPPIKAQMAI